MPEHVVRRSFFARLFRRLAGILIAGAVIGLVLHFAARAAHGMSGPADFKTGVLHGALMPLALPNLLVGDDVTIYASNNAGRIYKLGYTAGVNGCGLLFFGVFFWRVSRWRRAERAEIVHADGALGTPR